VAVGRRCCLLEMLDAAQQVVKVLVEVIVSSLATAMVAASGYQAASAVGLDERGRGMQDVVVDNLAIAVIEIVAASDSGERVVVVLAPVLLVDVEGVLGELVTHNTLLTRISMILHLDLLHDLLMVLLLGATLRAKLRVLSLGAACLASKLDPLPEKLRSIGRLDGLVALPLVRKEVALPAVFIHLRGLDLRYAPRQLLILLPSLAVAMGQPCRHIRRLQNIFVAPLLLQAPIVLRLHRVWQIEVWHLRLEASIGLVDFVGDVQEEAILGGQLDLLAGILGLVLRLLSVMACEQSKVEFGAGICLASIEIVAVVKIAPLLLQVLCLLVLLARILMIRTMLSFCCKRHLRGGKKLRLRMQGGLGRLHLGDRTLLSLELSDEFAFSVLVIRRVLLILYAYPRVVSLTADVVLDARLVQVLGDGVLVIREGAVVVDVLQHILVGEEVLPDLLGTIEKLSAALAGLEERLVALGVLEGLLVEYSIILEEARLVDLAVEL